MAPDIRFSWVLTAIGLITFLSLVPPAFSSQESDVFAVSGVGVDATAKTAAAARDQALAEGQKAALGRLFNRIVLSSDRDKLPNLDARGISDLVRDFEVSEERRSSVRYLAVLSVRFKADSIRELLRSHNIGFAETRSKPVLVLPVFEVAGAYSLWGEPNPWLDAWQAAPPSDGLVPLIRPSDDIKNAEIIGAEQAVRGNENRLTAIAQHYHAASVLVAVAGFRMGPGGGAEGQLPKPLLQITLSRIGTVLAEQTRLESLALEEGEAHDAAIARAVKLVTDEIQEAWKRDNLLRFGAGQEITVTVPLRSMDDWLFMKRRLAGVALIRRSDLLYLSRKEARLKINYIGDEKQLALALFQNDVILERGPVDWILRRARKNNAAVGAGLPKVSPDKPGGADPLASEPQPGSAP